VSSSVVAGDTDVRLIRMERDSWRARPGCLSERTTSSEQRATNSERRTTNDEL
jgi:hypothetical protein